MRVWNDGCCTTLQQPWSPGEGEDRDAEAHPVGGNANAPTEVDIDVDDAMLPISKRSDQFIVRGGRRLSTASVVGDARNAWVDD